MTTAVASQVAPGGDGVARASPGEGALGRSSKAVLKHSPTLLFDILAESDKDRQKAKLKGAATTLPPTVDEVTLDDLPTVRNSNSSNDANARQPNDGKRADRSARASPATGGGDAAMAAAAVAVAGRTSAEGPTGGSGSGAASGGQPKVADGAQSAFAGVEVVGASRRKSQESQATDGVGGVVSATGSGSSANDPLAEFTPRVILQELLGELFVPRERLHQQGTFGQGAFATVQSCSLEDPTGGPSLLVAVKSLKPEVLTDMEDLRRFLLEANLVRKLNHPNIVSIHGLGAHDLTSLDSLRSSAYVVMEALEGGDLRMMVLRQMTGRSPAYSRLDALRWCSHIAAGCAYLHETCRPMVIHRDLKLENVMLSGGPTDSRVAKITDFGLHKRARHSRTEDILIAVTNEWSTHGGSIYRNTAGGEPSVYAGAANIAGGGHGPGGGGSGHGAPAPPHLTKDPSFYGGRGPSAYDASYYGGNAYAGGNAQRGGSGHGAAAGGSTNARYTALAASGLAAVHAERSVRRGSIGGVATPDLSVHNGGGGSMHRARSGSFHGGSAMNGGSAHGASVHNGGGSVHDPSSHNGGGVGGGGLNGSTHAGSEAAEQLGLTAAAMAGGGSGSGHHRGGGGGGAPLGERERPYLLAHDRRYDAIPVPTSKFNSTNDLVGAHDAAVAAAAAAGKTVKAATAAVAEEEDLAFGAGHWALPNLVSPPPAYEESVHRKMLALMALESARAGGGGGGGGAEGALATAASLARVLPSGAASASTAAAAAGGGSVGGGGGGTGDGTAAEPFSVTEFVRAAAATVAEAGGGASPALLMRSMSLALQQVKEAEEAPAQSLSPTAGSLLPPPRPQRPSLGMKTVPEDNRMSMDLGARPPPRKSGGDGAASTASAPGGGRASLGSSAPPPSSSAGAAQRMTTRKERVASAAARMADATRQVGSLIYMAPELVTSTSYNEKVDVFSFAIIAFELFSGKLLAMKVANDAAYAEAASTAPTRGAGGVPTAETRSAEDAAEAGVMAYVMKRSSGVREALPSWWPPELRSLIEACWAQDPAKRPSFSKIFRDLRRMEQDGTLAEMDARDPTRGSGCGCTIC